jgi:D-aminopeptidase
MSGPSVVTVNVNLDGVVLGRALWNAALAGNLQIPSTAVVDGNAMRP